MTAPTTVSVAHGLCRCGCGQRTRLAPQSHTASGWIKGQPVGYVQGHQTRGRKITRALRPLAERFWAKVEKTETCWIWTGKVNHQGYGQIRKGRASDGQGIVHRLSYEMSVGPIPEGLHLDHLCRVRRCVRPDHLEPVTPAENIARSSNKGAQAVRTGRCIHGHDLSDAYVRRRGGRNCRTCVRLRDRQRTLAGAR